VLDNVRNVDSLPDMKVFCDDSYLMASNTDQYGNPIQNGVQYFSQCFLGMHYSASCD
jgi:hypothetical protein